MASLRKRKSGYMLIWTDSVNHPEKPQVSESLKTKDKRRAEHKRRELEWKYAEGEHDPWKRKWYERQRPDHIGLGEAVKKYIKYKRNAKGKEGWSYRRHNNVKFTLHKFVEITGDIPVGDIREAHLEAFYFRPKVNSSHTRRGYRIALITFFKWLQTQGYLQEYPDIELKPTKQKIPKFIYPDELAKLIQWKIERVRSKQSDGGHGVHEAHSQIWMVYGWMILAGTGMRPSELMRIKVDHIGREYINIGEDFDVKNAAERRIPLLYESKRAVEVLLQVRGKDKHMRGSEYLLGRPSDGSQKRLSKQFRKGWDKLFIHHRTLYNLKNMFAVRFLTDPHYQNQTHRLYELQQILGHKSIRSTERYIESIPYGVKIEGTIWDYFHEIDWSA